MNELTQNDLLELLETKYDRYNRSAFIESDPISIPHRYSKKEDIEIAGFLAATIAWGQRSTIVKNADTLMNLMGDAPYEFTLNHQEKDMNPFMDFKHRTFNGTDVVYFMKSLKNIYKNHGGISCLMENPTLQNGFSIKQGIRNFRKVFFELNNYPDRTLKHIANPDKNASAKRINMYLRWMVRDDKRGVDFGLWKKIKPYQLFCPLDVHTGNVARGLGLLNRKQNDWKAVEELTIRLKEFDAKDPVKYDFALFGLGMFEKWK